MLTVIIPCFNEETLVKKSFVQIFKALKYSKILKYEIIFIDDGSKDEVFRLYKNFKNKIKKLRF